MEYSSSENLDDGELWLPSDIFPVEETVSSTNNNNKLSSSLCCCYSCVLLLRHHHHNNHSSIFMAKQEESAAISLLQYRTHNTHSVPKPFPITERRFRPAERCCSCTDCSISEYFERNRRGTELLLTGSPPVQLQHQVESLMDARALILQKEEQNRFIRMQRRNLGLDRFTGNRVSSFVGGSGSGGGGGGGFNGESSSVRDYGGTGVFLPRIPININNNGRKRQGGRNWQDVQQTNQRYPCI
ncbi:uncharacterized protein LOC125836431 [Solanum verrucosum]|uniref:uncharacterized protein LOC125836431 n=1 Tax=Solanum verrucosum TaxID=315347 RepID=UPI0020D06FEB|nr:uncharacterized protein LOC125836431 [Solanum verrucosum]